MRMANGVEGAGYRLPSEFLVDDDFLIDKENFNNTQLDADFCEFPYDFQTQTHHLLQKFCSMSSSPQSTLANLGTAGGSNNGSPSGAQTPMGAKYDAVGDLIYLAAGQVAKLKLNRGYAVTSCPRYLPQRHKQAEISTPSVYLNKPFENIGPRAVSGGVGHAAWAPRQGRAALDGSGAAAKKVCAGTGVFLPRRYENINDSHAYSSAPRRRPVGTASPFQGRESVQIRTMPLMYRFVESRSPPQLQPEIGRDFFSEHNSMLARRHALALQHRSFLTPVAEGSSLISRDHPCLPPEWTY